MALRARRRRPGHPSVSHSPGRPSMKHVIRERARELGFDDCRFTTADAPLTAGHFQKWLTQGLQGEMAYLQRNAQKRVDPQQVLPGARSLVTLAVSYHQPVHTSYNSYTSYPRPAGLVARY